MPTISPGIDLEVQRLDRRQALLVLGEQAGELEHRPAARCAASRAARSRTSVSPIIMRLISATLDGLAHRRRRSAGRAAAP